ncbi:NAD-dependent epimerase/dehydratase family protein [Schumannella sp. 10F1B-5-1]|uniref:NAD-dependent epimerase/dehydratase family protein n=1 Tax=Schumannella sp. 10F1B-5-1 TaxID=2590780 RepID=UPI001131294B|nr:NAD-dependent epimerase/dehydratase family protein [Schumannella sp. 10F1B-5-1]TPW73014.1 NAD-dependent epimerase/dehydratase family protein [Schumannella sp. 10F1B-5-1]
MTTASAAPIEPAATGASIASDSPPAAPVLVTGGSGFIAGHVILQLLAAGRTVRATVRSLASEPKVRAELAAAGLSDADGARLSFVAADLLDDAGWAEAVAGAPTIIHVASPVHLENMTDEDDVIRPAREGTLRVLRAARDAGARRVVLTGAFHAVGFGQPHDHDVFTEDDWSPLDGRGMDAYGRSKVLAERAAWEFVEQVRADGGELELVTLLPVAVMGPVLGTGVSGSNHIIQRMLTGGMPAFPNMNVPIVDVRDVAAAHVSAASAPSDAVAGKRILVATGEDAIALADVGALLRENLGDAAAKVPTRRLPDFVVKAMALKDPNLRSMAADLGFAKQISNERLRTLLRVTPRPGREAALAAAESLVAKGMIG